jgi:hypothetical protein
MVFGAILESSRLSLSLSLYSPSLPSSEVSDAQVDCWRGCFIMSWLGGDFFPRGMMRWMGYPLHQPMAHSCLLRGWGLPVRCRLVLSWW